MRIESPDVYVGATGTARGRGVFAARAFEEGEVVEEAPVVLFALSGALPDEIRQRMFHWDRSMRVDVPGSPQAIALGYGSMYNHANPANLRYEPQSERQVMRYVAVRGIQIGEELTINYNSGDGGHVSDNDQWFLRMGVERID